MISQVCSLSASVLLSCETQRMENKFEYKKVISVRLTTYNENYLDSDVNANNLIDGN